MTQLIEALKGGEVLTEPIVSQGQETLIPEGTVLKTEYLPLIRSLGIRTVSIDVLPLERETTYEYGTLSSVIPVERLQEYVRRTKRIMEGHIHNTHSTLREFETIANEILKDVQGMSEGLRTDVRIEDIRTSTNLYEHTIRVTILSALIGRRMNLERKQLYGIAIGSLLHDIGIRYITVPYEHVDFKSMKQGEVFELKKHTILGYSALEGESWVSDIVRKMVLFHHERIDGSGYPMRQRNQEMECRILQVCDGFDSYISGMEGERHSLSETLCMLEKEAGRSLDKSVVEQLLSIVAPRQVGAKIFEKKVPFSSRICYN